MAGAGGDVGGIVSLTTDFGLLDWYVGAMKAAILGRCPRVQIVDICHEVPPQQVRSGAFVLSRCWRGFAPGSVHVAVVDPGVGGDRGLLLGKCSGHWFVGPDNGLIEAAVWPEKLEARWLLDADRAGLPAVSPTFHGRDVFGPVAGLLMAGRDPDTLGGRCVESGRVAAGWPVVQTLGAEVEVLWVDRFGNLLTGANVDAVASECVVWLGEVCVGGLRRTYSDVAEGDLLALRGSDGCLEVAKRNGRADRALGVGPGSVVRLVAGG